MILYRQKRAYVVASSESLIVFVLVPVCTARAAKVEAARLPVTPDFLFLSSDYQSLSDFSARQNCVLHREDAFPLQNLFLWTRCVVWRRGVQLTLLCVMSISKRIVTQSYLHFYTNGYYFCLTSIVSNLI